MPFMPLDIVRLLDSDLYALSSGDEFKAAFSLWAKSFLQVPAASLPDDDRVLSHLSGAGARWHKLRPMALRGWIKCSDGRLYHPVVAEKAVEAWAARKAQRARTEAARAARAAHRKPTTTDTVTEPVTDTVTGSKGQGQGQGQLEKKEDAGASAGARPPPSNVVDLSRAQILLDQIVLIVEPETASRPGWLIAGEILRWIEGGADPELDILPTIRRIHAERAGKPGYPPSSPRYFTRPIADALAQRLQPMPEGEIRRDPASRQPIQQPIRNGFIAAAFEDAARRDEGRG